MRDHAHGAATGPAAMPMTSATWWAGCTGRSGGRWPVPAVIPRCPTPRWSCCDVVERQPGIGVSRPRPRRCAPLRTPISTLVGELVAAGLLERARRPDEPPGGPAGADRGGPGAAVRVPGGCGGGCSGAALADLDDGARADLLRAVPHLARLADLVDRTGRERVDRPTRPSVRRGHGSAPGGRAPAGLPRDGGRRVTHCLPVSGGVRPPALRAPTKGGRVIALVDRG